MATFAELDLDNNVINVIKVDDVDTQDENGVENEAIGLAFLANLFPGRTFIKTSFNARIRKNYASIGGFYNPELDAFMLKQPFSSWVLDTTTCRWQAPIPFPSDGNRYIWNEDTQSWDLVDTQNV